MQTKIAQAVAIIRNSPELGDEDVYRALVEAGFERRLAARLVEFLPAVYCRALLEDGGVTFPDTFRRCCKDGSITHEMPIASEPVWEAALEFARREIEQGVTPEQILQVAGRSAEFQAANDLLNKGSKLENIAFTPAVFPWPEEGPEAKPILPPSTKRGG